MIKIPAGKWRSIVVGIAGALLIVLNLEVGFNWRRTAVGAPSFFQEPVSN
jgi:hypothetical protein